MCNSVAFKYIHNVMQHPHYLVPEHFYHPKKETLYPLSSYPPFPHSPAPATTELPNLLSSSTDMPILDILYKWDHTICALLCLASFTQHKVFKIHPSYKHVPVFHSFLW